MRVSAGLHVALVLLIALQAPASAQDPGRPAVLPLDSLRWLTGRWMSCDEQPRHEGVWMEPLAGSISGLFRVSHGSEILRYELFVLEQSPAGPLLSRQIFGAALSPDSGGGRWTRLRLREADGTRARFSPSDRSELLGVTLELSEGDRLRVTVERSADGERSFETVDLYRRTE
jgi:Domain of unknown function (DUF6265)